MGHNFNRSRGFYSLVPKVASLLLPRSVCLRQIRESYALCSKEFYLEVHKVVLGDLLHFGGQLDMNMSWRSMIGSLLILSVVVGVSFAVGLGSFQGGPVEAMQVIEVESGLGAGVPALAGVPVIDVPDIDMAAGFRCRVRDTASPGPTEMNCERECTGGGYALKVGGAEGSRGTVECRDGTTGEILPSGGCTVVAGDSNCTTGFAFGLGGGQLFCTAETSANHRPASAVCTVTP